MLSKNLLPTVQISTKCHLLLWMRAKIYYLNIVWPGNIRQLKNIAEQISVLEPKRDITPEILNKYLPFILAIICLLLLKKGGGAQSDTSFTAERDMLYKVLFDMKKELSDLKKLFMI